MFFRGMAPATLPTHIWMGSTDYREGREGKKEREEKGFLSGTEYDAIFHIRE